MKTRGGDCGSHHGFWAWPNIKGLSQDFAQIVLTVQYQGDRLIHVARTRNDDPGKSSTQARRLRTRSRPAVRHCASVHRKFTKHTTVLSYWFHCEGEQKENTIGD